MLNNSNEDELYQQAIDLVIREHKASTSFIQRHFRIGYNRAATIIEKMEENNIISKDTCIHHETMKYLGKIGCELSYYKLFNQFSFTVYDETHHYCSKVFSNAFYKIGSKYNLGLTATLKRADKLEYTLEWFLGKPVVNIQLLIIEPQIHIHSYYEYLDTTIKYLPNGKVNTPSSITSITELNKRDEFILDFIKKYYVCDRNILVLTDRKSHCDKLYTFLKHNHSVGLYYGGMKQDELKKSNECKIIVATYQMASEGYDNPKLDTLILASPKGNVEQAVGRILRRENKNPALVIDINDCISVFNNWNRKRLMFYKSRKFKIEYFNKEEIELLDEDIKNECLIKD